MSGVFEKAREVLANVERLDELIAREQQRIQQMKDSTHQLLAQRQEWRRALLEDSANLSDAVHAFEQELITRVMLETNGGVTAAAKITWPDLSRARVYAGART